MDEEACLPLCMEGSFFWLPQDDMTMDVDIRGKWQLLQPGTLPHRTADDENYCCREMLVGGTAAVQKPGLCSLTIL